MDEDSEIIENGTELHHSVSSLKTFAQCPFKYYHQYILREKEPLREYLEFGTAVHRAIELQIGEKKLEHKDSVDEAIEESRMKLDKNKVWNYSIVPKEYENIPESKKVEYKFSKTFDNCETAFVGKIDLLYHVNNEVHIVDWKTGKKIYCPDVQVAIYSWIAMEEEKVESVIGSLYFLGFHKEEKKIFNKEEIKQAVDWASLGCNVIERRKKMLDSGVFPNVAFWEKKNKYCYFCSWKNECSKYGKK